ncbi:hypothetical protein ACPXCE_15990 [Streptomyces sp. DT24]|uniref:hypothetical protein n=1 Tax=unclassified Streptomyces TaxID=2593676 RepID=UPI0023B9EAFA|nr:hypothetical protein [Streptomyces sp. AM 4-1-1]WEH35176.1 hypothetical protein PZB75_18510 [Streptomyces sp. AM 4-1-1]
MPVHAPPGERELEKSPAPLERQGLSATAATAHSPSAACGAVDSVPAGGPAPSDGPGAYSPRSPEADEIYLASLASLTGLDADLARDAAADLGTAYRKRYGPLARPGSASGEAGQLRSQSRLQGRPRREEPGEKQ